MKLSIFGSTGFIGKNFEQRYPGNILIDRDSRKPLSNNILYLISTIHNYNIFKDASIDVNTNISILCNVLNHCKEKDIVFNFVSSWVVYGDLKQLPAKEAINCNPKGFYSITKKCAEDLLISFCEAFNIKYRILRLSNIIGKGLDTSNNKHKLANIIHKLKLNEQIDLYDNGNFTRDILHIEDACRAINMICTKGNYNEIYNIGSGEPIKIGSFINMARIYIKSESKIVLIKEPKFHSLVHTKNFWMDIEKLKNLGFHTKFTTKDMIKELLD
tara:strand:+ start:1141 stop:1956 length:816 start_codon:yes stop_codon:yes gene_type:complete